MISNPCCPVCGSERPPEEWEAQGTRWLRCPDCGYAAAWTEDEE